MANPGIEELRDSGKYELFGQLNHTEIKEFVIEQLTGNGKLVRFFMYYQLVMIIIGIFFFTRSIVKAFQDVYPPLFYSLAALVFCFSILIIIHELLHAIALLFTGTRKISFGGYLRKFIFYAEADRHVLNRKQFAFVALTPFIAVKVITLTGLILFLNEPAFYFFIFVMSAHSLFCAGDIGLLSLFFSEKDLELYTFDVKEEKTSYYYRRIVNKN